MKTRSKVSALAALLVSSLVFAPTSDAAEPIKRTNRARKAVKRLLQEQKATTKRSKAREVEKARLAKGLETVIGQFIPAMESLRFLPPVVIAEKKSIDETGAKITEYRNRHAVVVTDKGVFHLEETRTYTAQVTSMNPPKIEMLYNVDSYDNRHLLHPINIQGNPALKMKSGDTVRIEGRDYSVSTHTDPNRVVSSMGLKASDLRSGRAKATNQVEELARQLRQ